MRMKQIRGLMRGARGAGLGLLLMLSGGLAARAQNADELMPAASAAKAKEILQQATDALGGAAYLNVHNSDCTGRLAQFEHSGALGGYTQFHSYHEMPDKSRMEYDPLGKIVDLYAGKDGWSLDRSGVSELPASAIADYQEQLQTEMNTILRFRMNDPALVFRYDGKEVVDLKVADWVEVGDHDGHTLRIAIDQKSHFPLRSMLSQRDKLTGEKMETGALFSSYHLIDGIQTPFQVVRTRNDQPVSQVFYESCHYDADLPANLFTRVSLDQRFAKEKKK